MADVDTLYTWVTNSILQAEEMEGSANSKFELAWLETALIERQIAQIVSASQVEGMIARRGAVRAAIKAGHVRLAKAWADKFKSERECDEALMLELDKLF